MNAFETLLMPEKAEIRFNAGMCTLPSINHPDTNHDAVLFDPDNGNFGIFDGKGDTRQGKEAAQFAQNYFQTRLPQINCRSEDEFPGVLQTFHDLIDEAGVLLRRNVPDGDTTATFSRILNVGGGYALVGNVGDSRFYTFNGRLVQHTLDHGALMSIHPARARSIAKKLDEVRFVEELSNDTSIPIVADENDSRSIQSAKYGNLKAEIDPASHDNRRRGFLSRLDRISEAELFFMRGSLISTLGNCRAKTVRLVNLEDVRLLLLASDGPTDNLRHSEIARLLQENESDPHSAASNITEEARRLSDLQMVPDENGVMRGNIRAKYDDMSAVVVKLH